MAENRTYQQDNKTEDSELSSGYGLELTGMKDGLFYFIHILALCFLFLSLVSAIAVLISSFKCQGKEKFFSRTKAYRFVVYLSICDGLYSIAHSMDHIHMTIAEDHVYPKELCAFYGFWNSVFIGAQNLLVSIIAVNAFLLTYLGVDIRFGRRDWKLLTFIFGVPLVSAVVAASTDSLGPNGTACFFDAVKGKVSYVALGVGPLITIFVINVILYSLTASKLFAESARLKTSLGCQSIIYTASRRATRNMTLFVLAFFVQWWALTAFGIWQVVSSIPPNFSEVATVIVIFTNTGGILNGIIFLVLKRRKRREEKEQSNTACNLKHARATSSPRIHSTLARKNKAHSEDVVGIEITEIKENIRNDAQRFTSEEPIGSM